MVARYKANGFDIILTDSEILVKTKLQVSLLYCEYYTYKAYLDYIRIKAPEIKTFADLFSYFYHPISKELIIKMREVKEQWYL